MKIAQIAPIIECVPPKKYGGTERVVYSLTEELVKRGHDVTLFASGDSQTSAKLVSVYPTALRQSKEKDIYGPNIWSLLNVGMAYHMQERFDIIHDHNSQNNPVSLPLADAARIPVVTTLHGALDAEAIARYEIYQKPYLISISKAQRRVAPQLNYIANVYNGLTMEKYPFSAKPGEYLLYVGRISAEKGVHYAIEVALQLNLPLIIAAKLDPADEPYYKKMVEPKLSGQIKWVGEVDETTRNDLMKNALCFLHPVQWPEPFGLTLIEAMACGCPVVAFAKGSIPEVVAHRKAGFVVNNINEMIDCVGKISTIDRKACREYALTNFSAQKMAEQYEQVYQQLLEQPSAGSAILNYEHTHIHHGHGKFLDYQGRFGVKTADLD